MRRLRSSSRFSTISIVVFAVIFASVGGYFLWKSFAANPNLTGDINNDNKVDISDLSILLSNYGTSNTAADLNSDGAITITDLSILLSNYNRTYTPPAPASGRFGISAGGAIEWDSPTDLARQLDGYVAIGAKWLRFDGKWSVIESNKGTYNWAIYDNVINQAKSRGINVLLNLAYSPSWATPGGNTDDKYAPVNVNDYANFAQKAVQHFSPLGVKHYEIWNEPNLNGFWKPAPDVVKYSALVKAAYPLMKAADPTITVMAGATSPAGGYNDPACNGSGNSGSPNINPINFLQGMYNNGVGGNFDALSHHPYAGSAGVFGTHVCNAWYEMAGTNPSLRSVMTANGDSSKKIWGTEYGTDLAWLNNNESTQAQHVTEAFSQWLTYPWAGQLMYYSYHEALSGFDLVRPDWSQRPAWTAYKNAPKQ